MRKANPYLNFDGNTEEAFQFYRAMFGGEFLQVVRFRDFGENPMGVPEHQLDRIAHIALSVGENMLMGTDLVDSHGTRLNPGNNFYIHLEADSTEEAKRLFSGLAEGGRVEMPLQRTEWSQDYGICIDRFGVQWMVDHTGDVQMTLGQPE